MLEGKRDTQSNGATAQNQNHDTGAIQTAYYYSKTLSTSLWVVFLS